MIDSVAVYTTTTVNAAATQESNFVAPVVSTKTTWANAVLQAKITNGSVAVKPGEMLTVYYAWTAFSGVATGAPLRSTAKIWNIPLSSTVSDVTYASSPLCPAQGSDLYVWLSHEAWDQARTIDMKVGGLP